MLPRGYPLFCYFHPRGPPAWAGWGTLETLGWGAEEKFQHEMFCSLTENLGGNSLFAWASAAQADTQKLLYLKNKKESGLQSGVGAYAGGGAGIDVLSPPLRLLTCRGFQRLNPSSFRRFYPQCLRLPLKLPSLQNRRNWG